MRALRNAASWFWVVLEELDAVQTSTVSLSFFFVKQTNPPGVLPAREKIHGDAELQSCGSLWVRLGCSGSRRGQCTPCGDELSVSHAWVNPEPALPCTMC